ncbi:MAG TPA: type II secretion system F family protein, partial [Solirubrobacteraceae bacterium]|nr:type II secretion system F family protein [Solirubrobacteraceae bacterium]
MEAPVAGLLLLLLGGLLALAGFWLLEAAAVRRAALASGEPRQGRSRLRGLLDRRVRATGPGRALVVRLETAGVERSPIAFLLGTAALAFLTYVLARALVPGFLALIAALATVGGAFAWLDRRREQRRLAFVAQLPELARLLSNGAAAGLAMTQALERASRELDAPAGPELRRAVAELRLSVPLDETLERLGRRLPSRQLSVLVTTLVIQQRAGGNVVRALQELATTLEARQETLREVRTLMSGAVFSSYLVAGLGVLTILMMSSFGGDVLDRFTETGLGRAVLLFAALLYTLGFV